MNRQRTEHLSQELCTLLAPLAALLWMIRAPLGVRTSHIWGPEDPWANNDWVGNLWMWWRTAEARTGTEWNTQIVWPSGGGDLNAVFPNRIDAWLAAPWANVDALAAWWNNQALLHIGLAALSLPVLLRIVGVSRWGTVLASTFAISAPVWLHELAGGRMATFVIWPGLLSIAAISATNRWAPRRHLLAALAGLLCGLQFLAYPFYGLVVAGIAATLLLCSKSALRQRLLTLSITGAACAIVCLPSLLTWSDAFQSADSLPPPAGYTSLTLQGALGFTEMPGRFRVVPGFFLLVGAACAHHKARLWAVGALTILIFAMGPEIRWSLGATDGVSGPMHLLTAVSETLRRMHHPIRLVPFALATGAVALGLAFDRLSRQAPKRVVPVGSLIAMTTICATSLLPTAFAWEGASTPEGVNGARFLAARQGPVAHVTTRDHAGLPHQLWHRQAVLASTQGFAPPPDRQDTQARRGLLKAVEALRAGRSIGLATASLRNAGVRSLLVTAEASPTGQAFLAERRASLLTVAGDPLFVSDTALVFALANP